ncbi:MULTISPECIES: ECF transporter S component [Terrabacteria group]|uniref:ECF transporter S component n=1 Tax=Bacillati TaxID=1783272 RepID=UPI001C931C25|nr:MULTISPECIES: ECF transporter S component [Terrabacteria group]
MNTKRFTLMALMMTLVIVLSSFSLTVPGGHLYLNDVVIVLSALLFSPKDALLVCGLGAFLGDFFFYPSPMFVSLVTHGVQGYVISYLAHSNRNLISKNRSLIAACVGAFIMVGGYTFGRAFVYSTLKTSLIKLPFQILQASVGVIFGYFLRYHAVPKQIEEIV